MLMTIWIAGITIWPWTEALTKIPLTCLFRLLITKPDLVMVNALPEMIDHVKSLFKVFQPEDFKILVGYDTQFQLTDGYVREI